jgi:glycosyltransferase involved in cell wall biosynthesis
MTQVNVHWICPELTHYHAHFFSTLCQHPDTNLTVHFLSASSAHHPWKRKPSLLFAHRTVDVRWGIDFSLFRLALNGSNKFVVAGWNNVFMILFLLWLSLLGRDFLFWSDTPNQFKKRSLPKRIFRGFIAAVVFRKARKILGTGRPGVEAFRAMGCPENKLISFPYFVPLNGCDPFFGENLFSVPTRILSLGRLDNSVKGYDIGLEALAKVMQSRGSDSFRYSICGTGPDLDEMQKRVHTLGLSGNVEFWGWQEVDEVTKMLKTSHILLHPARWEPFGVAVLEAMALGPVVVASEATCAAQDRIINGLNGFLHTVGDVSTIAGQLEILITDRERLLHMSQAARRTAEEWPASRGVQIIKSAFLS